MEQLFKKVACFTDIHFGMRQNSKAHNQDCENFINWFCATATAAGAETCIFLGDWHHHRATVNVSTLNYTVKNLETLSQNFEKVYFITGNHDLYYREKRELNSLPFAKNIDNIVMVDEVLQLGDVAIIPWLVEDEWTKMRSLKERYVFGHFELPNFYMNAMVAMPDHGGLNSGHFPNQEYVFSGHFHKRQSRGNIHYIGNAFPHNYADAGDDDRGMMVLEWGKEPEYHSWPDQPKYRVYQLSDVLQHTETMLQPGMHVRVNLDVDISYEEATFIKETFVNTYKLREITLLPQKTVGDEITFDTQGNIMFESVDSIVTNQLTNIDSKQYDPNLLLDIYRHL